MKLSIVPGVKTVIMIWSLNRKIILGTAMRLTPTFIIPIFQGGNENDSINPQADLSEKTGWDRVRAMYSKK